MQSPKSTWVDVPPLSDFPIDNIPFGVIQSATLSPRVATAIGDFVVDLHALQLDGFFSGVNIPWDIFNKPYLNEFFALGRKTISEVRDHLISMLSSDSSLMENERLNVARNFYNREEVKLLMPLQVRNYTDFYSSEEHASNVGSMFRDPKNALLPNWKHLPVAYHGRPSSIVVSGTEIFRPNGQIKVNDDAPIFSPSRKLDFELEVAFTTCAETGLGESVSVNDAEKLIAGFVLFNDWSARDIQQWEYVPLGPFLGKNFASTVSPWVVTLDALEPFRTEGPAQSPVLPYLQVSGAKNFDVELEVFLAPDNSEEVLICRSNMKFLYWNINQQLAHHTVNGCNIQVGDLYASGTISGPKPDSFGSMLELSWNGKNQLAMHNGTTRTFLEDGDTIIFRAHAVKGEIRIGFGECRGKILPAKQI
jgi:fumarylacetoacetase